MNEKILSLLGLARRAGRLSAGHDAVVESVVKNKAKLCVLCRDASPRLERELKHACCYDGKNIPVVCAEFDMTRLSKAIGTKAAVISINDEGFSKKLLSMFADSSSLEKKEELPLDQKTQRKE